MGQEPQPPQFLASHVGAMQAKSRPLSFPDHEPRITLLQLLRHNQSTKKDPMKILITGSTGLVGTALAQDLQRAGHAVCRLIRPGTCAGNSPGFDVSWNPSSGELGGAAVGADAVVNLAGASIAEKRWTPQRKQLLRASRVDTTRALVQALAKMSARPRV